jgi:hypothetical protein
MLILLQFKPYLWRWLAGEGDRQAEIRQRQDDIGREIYKTRQDRARGTGRCRKGESAGKDGLRLHHANDAGEKLPGHRLLVRVVGQLIASLWQSRQICALREANPSSFRNASSPQLQHLDWLVQESIIKMVIMRTMWGRSTCFLRMELFHTVPILESSY